MARRQYFAVLDTETTVNATVADIGIAIVDRNGKIYNQMAVLVSSEFLNHELFHQNGDKFWTREYAEYKKMKYQEMLANGSRMLASVAAVNMWISKAIGKYNPVLTAYNLPFDVSKCNNTAIDLSGFTNRFCLWGAAASFICNTKPYRQFVLQNHLFNKPTEHGNMTYKTKAENVCQFLTGNTEPEPHTAIEDAVNYEVPILVHLLKNRKWQDLSGNYNWNNFQVRDNFKV